MRKPEDLKDSTLVRYLAESELFDMVDPIHTIEMIGLDWQQQGTDNQELLAIYPSMEKKSQYRVTVTIESLEGEEQF